MAESLLKTLLDNWIPAIILFAIVASLITSIAKQIRKYACHRNEVELKRDLVERGLPVDEIERVIAAKGNTTTKDSAG